MIYSIDFETRSHIELKDRGLDVYANDPSTEVLCIAFGTSEDSVEVWNHQGDSIQKLLHHVEFGGKIQA